LEQLKGKLVSAQGNDLVSQAINVNGLNVVASKMDGADVKTLRDTVDQLKNKLKSAAIVLGTIDGDKVTLIAGVTDDWSSRVKAGDLVNMVAQQVGGRGGGRADMAQAGGSEPAKLPSALASVEAWVRQKLV
jgi:alanyl-tRNA synthetase